MTLRSDLPGDCVLAFAIPLSRDDFISDLLGRDRKEYARRFESQLAALSQDTLWARYEAAVVAPALLAIEAAGCEGVRVELRMTAALLPQALRDRRVLTLFAHWRQGGFSPDSIPDPGQYVYDIQESQGPLGRALAKSLLQLASVDATSLAEFLNESLRNLFVVFEYPEPSGASWIANDPQQNLDRNYEVLRAEFPHWRLPPAGMELADGIQTVSDLVSMFSADYTGVVDLRMCNSMLPGEAIKRVAPRAQVLMNRELVAPEVQLVFYKHTILLLHSGMYDYVGAAMALRKAVLKKLI